MDGWGEEDNAPRYETFARLYPMYRQTSRELVTLAAPGHAATVLDLACGTGAATQEILTVLGPDGTVIGVDKSPAMLEVAAKSITDRRVTWIEARAEDMDQHVANLVDVVICNSAIWQTDLAATFAAVRKLLADNGRFVFNVADGFLADNADPNHLGDLLDAMLSIAQHDYGWRPPATGAQPRRRSRLSRESISRLLDDTGFAIDRIEDFDHQQSAEVQRAWLSVPIFSRSYLPGMPYSQRMQVLARAYQRVDTRAATERWVAFAAKAAS